MVKLPPPRTLTRPATAAAAVDCTLVFATSQSSPRMHPNVSTIDIRHIYFLIFILLLKMLLLLLPVKVLTQVVISSCPSCYSLLQQLRQGWQ
jgi:hypothetical protein